MHVTQVARSGVGADLGALAELLSDDIPDAALVLTPALRTALAKVKPGSMAILRVKRGRITQFAAVPIPK